jgi:hypothetical protein
MSDEQDQAPAVPAPAAGKGKCEECAANRRRLIGLAADVAGFRRTVERLDAMELTDLTKRLDLVEMVMYGLLGYLVTSAIIDARRELRREPQHG